MPSLYSALVLFLLALALCTHGRPVPGCDPNCNTTRSKRCAPIILPFLGGLAFAAGTVTGNAILGREKRSIPEVPEQHDVREKRSLGMIELSPPYFPTWPLIIKPFMLTSGVANFSERKTWPL